MIGDDMTLKLVATGRDKAAIEVQGQHHVLHWRETLDLADNISVTLLDIDSRTARFGIDAPKTVVVHREEVAVRIAAQAVHS